MRNKFLNLSCLLLIALSSCVLMQLAVAEQPRHDAAEQAEFVRPPLGWGSWNSFANSFNSETIQEQAQAMVSSGMKAAGYQYVLLDEGWWLGQRDAAGNIVVEKKQWPAIEPGETAGDMANIVRYIHKQGLKAGIYTDAGADGCSTWWPDTGPKMPHTGSLDHYRRDFLQFAKWGFDYVKVDWCGGDKPNLDPLLQYAEIARAMGDAERETGHHLFYSICNWGKQKPWTWAPGVGGSTDNMWRTGGDIVDPIVADGDPKHEKRTVTTKNVYTNFDAGIHPEAQHTGYYNDLDMMVVGMRGTNEQLDRLHMSLWAIAGAPLIVGADLTKLQPKQIAVLTETEVLAIEQDAAGLQGYKLASSKQGLDVFVKPLAQAGHRAVLMMNRTKQPASTTFDLTELGLKQGASATVRDVWAKRDFGKVERSFEAKVEPDTGLLLLVSGTEAPSRKYTPDIVGRRASATCAQCSEETMARSYTTFRHVQGSGGFTKTAIKFRGATRHAASVMMQVGDGTPTRVEVAADGVGMSDAVVLVELRRGENEVRFWSEDGRQVGVSEIDVPAE